MKCLFQISSQFKISCDVYNSILDICSFKEIFLFIRLLKLKCEAL